MLILLLSGCGLFHALSEPPMIDDTGPLTTDTDSGMTETGTDTGTDTDTGTVILPLDMALYTMVIKSNNIQIDTFNLLDGTMVNTIQTEMTGNTNRKNAFIITHDQMLMATGNTDRLLYGFNIDDNTGLLQATSWSPLHTESSMFALANSLDLVYGLADTYVEVFEYNATDVDVFSSYDVCEDFCFLYDIAAKKGRDGFVAIYSNVSDDQYSFVTGNSLVEELAGADLSFYGPAAPTSLVSYGNQGLAYAPAETSISAIGTDNKITLFDTWDAEDFRDLAFSPDNSMVYAINRAGELFSYRVLQQGLQWEDGMMNSAPERSRHIFASEQFLAISSTESVWVYDLDSSGRPNNLIHQINVNGNGQFGPIVIVEGVSGN